MKNVYGFSFHLKKVGDFVETFALPFEDRLRIHKAAHIWAYRKKYKVTTETVGTLGGRGIRITLVSKYR